MDVLVLIVGVKGSKKLGGWFFFGGRRCSYVSSLSPLISLKVLLWMIVIHSPGNSVVYTVFPRSSIKGKHGLSSIEWIIKEAVDSCVLEILMIYCLNLKNKEVFAGLLVNWQKDATHWLV